MTSQEIKTLITQMESAAVQGETIEPNAFGIWEIAYQLAVMNRTQHQTMKVLGGFSRKLVWPILNRARGMPIGSAGSGGLARKVLTKFGNGYDSPCEFCDWTRRELLDRGQNEQELRQRSESSGPASPAVSQTKEEI